MGFSSVRTGIAPGGYDRHLYMANDGSVYFGVYPGELRTIRSATSPCGTTPLALNDGQWHHIAASLSSVSGPNSMSLHVDGSLNCGSNKATAGENYSGWWRVGADNVNYWPDVPTSRYFAGSVAAAAVFTRVLTPAEVERLYKAGAPNL